VKRLFTLLLIAGAFAAPSQAQSKAMVGTVVKTIVGGRWSGIVIQVGNKRYGAQTSYEPSAGDEARGEKSWQARTVGTVDEGHRVEVYYTKMDCSHAYEEGVPCWLTATRVVELKPRSTASSAPSTVASTTGTNSRRNSDWDRFWNRFSAAVRNKNRAAIKSMALDRFDWQALDNTVGAWIRNLDRNNLWFSVQNSVNRGTTSCDAINGRSCRCTRDNHLYFVFKDNRWHFSGIGGI
jgi:hypothetical protein